MEENIKLLKEKFIGIRSLKFIKSIKKGFQGLGYTFENLLVEKELYDNLEIPDFNGIELKSIRYYSRRNISLFHCEPDGKYMFETERIRKKYGYKNLEYNCNVFALNVSTNVVYFKNNFFKLRVDYKKKIVILEVANNYYKDEQTFWTFDILKEKLERKLQYLAVTKAYYKSIDGNDYYRYAYLTIYKNVIFKKFLELIDDGKIFIKFNISIFKSDYRNGQIHNHGTAFVINEKELIYMYTNYEKI